MTSPATRHAIEALHALATHVPTSRDLILATGAVAKLVTLLRDSHAQAHYSMLKVDTSPHGSCHTCRPCMHELPCRYCMQVKFGDTRLLNACKSVSQHCGPRHQQCIHDPITQNTAKALSCQGCPFSCEIATKLTSHPVYGNSSCVMQ